MELKDITTYLNNEMIDYTKLRNMIFEFYSLDKDDERYNQLWALVVQTKNRNKIISRMEFALQIDSILKGEAL
jgi:hypothetical protein